MSARFRKTRRYTKVVCCVLKLCTRFFHQAVHGHQTVHAVSARHGHQTVHAVSARFRKTRRYTKVVCCVLKLCTRFFYQAVHGHQTVHAVSARFRKTRRYTKVVCCVLMIPVLDVQLLENALKMKCPCCERQIPQDEALYKSGLLRAEILH